MLMKIRSLQFAGPCLCDRSLASIDMPRWVVVWRIRTIDTVDGPIEAGKMEGLRRSAAMTPMAGIQRPTQRFPLFWAFPG
jgi:hypothetical protein